MTYDAGKTTVGEYVERHIEDSVKDTIRKRTYERYEQVARVHIKPYTNPRARFVSRETRCWARSPYCPYIHVTLNKALKQAVADGLIPRNAASSV